MSPLILLEFLLFCAQLQELRNFSMSLENKGKNLKKSLQWNRYLIKASHFSWTESDFPGQKYPKNCIRSIFAPSRIFVFNNCAKSPSNCLQPSKSIWPIVRTQSFAIRVQLFAKSHTKPNRMEYLLAPYNQTVVRISRHFFSIIFFLWICPFIAWCRSVFIVVVVVAVILVADVFVVVAAVEYCV